jgi:hypothetical protein
MGVEQPQLLAAVDRVEGVVDVQGDPLGNFSEGRAIEVDHGAAHAQKRPYVGQVLQPRDRRLRAKLAIGRRQIHRHLEQRIVAQARGVVAVLVAGGDHQQSKTNDVGKTVRDLIRRAPVHQAGGQPIGDPETSLRLPQRQNAAVRRQQPPIEFGHHGLAVNRRQASQRQHRIGHGGCGLAEIERIGFDNQILHEIR